MTLAEHSEHHSHPLPVRPPAITERIAELKSYLAILSKQGGPELADYSQLDGWMTELHTWKRQRLINDHDLAELRDTLGDALSPKTLQGFAYSKPHGYAGDFEIIDKIYQHQVSTNPRLTKWDVYWQNQAAAKAVRNRKAYFHALLDEYRQAANGRTLRILNVASGSGRDMFEYFELTGAEDVEFVCVEQDANAIRYASALCAPHLGRIRFVNQNALRLTLPDKFDLIWSAGLFDYFGDRLFRGMIKRLLPRLAEDGVLVIGNFSDNNPTQHYMTFFDWILRHRSRSDLLNLARGSGVSLERVHVGSEHEGVNLFLHLTATPRIN